MPYNFTAIEKKWQRYWLQNKTFAAIDPSEAGGMPKAYVLDMFPYPSGSGLHVGHPEGYTATDIFSRYLRMKGVNVLHPMGWDAFGLPAEQYAIKTNTHPRRTTEKNIENFRKQIQMLGLSYDWDREVDTTDPGYYKWTQWIFVQLFNSYFDPIQNRAMPIAHLTHELMNDNLVIAPDGSVKINPVQEGLQAISGDLVIERHWRTLSPEEQRDVIDGQRLAFMDEVPVNWCPALGTVLANEEVIDGRSEVGGFPVERRPLRQWMLRITAYADRLVKDLDLLAWPESLKEMQRNWIGKSIGAEVDFAIDASTLAQAEEGDDELEVTVFTTRPDTLYGATYMVLAPEHPLVDRITSPQHRESIEAYRTMVRSKSDRDRMAETKDKTGIFTGANAINPVNGEKIPVYIADYVLMGYGTGAIMAVPGHDQRDWDFAKKFNLPIKPVVRSASGKTADGKAFEEEGIAINSGPLDGLTTTEAKDRIISQLENDGTGHRSLKYKLRDWLFSRQRYWGEPFPILLDAQGNASAVAESELPIRLPEMEDFKPTGTPEPPLSKVKDWVNVSAGFMRETNTMPQWAGSCWYYLRYIDPKNDKQFVDPAKEKYWMPVDLYVGGVEHAVLHLLYSRFWHKVLFDLGHVSTPEPFARLVNQGLILGETEFHFFESSDGKAVSAADIRDIGEEATTEGLKLVGYHRETGTKIFAKPVPEVLVEKSGDGYVLRANPSVRVDARSFKMSKSRGNVVNPDNIVRDYGADAFRLYEMYMGPLEAQKPWSTRDIVGMLRFLNSVWRNLIGDEEAAKVVKIGDTPLPAELDRQMHRTIKKVSEDIEGLRFNTGIAELIKLNNEMGRLDPMPRELAENFALMLAPFAPHVAEEIWEKLGHTKSLARRPWPTFDAAKLVESTIELPVQVNGKLRGKITVPADASESQILDAAANESGVRAWLDGKDVKKRIYVAKKLVSFVIG
ncbi:MAG TPA: leucine--tRNA ligase [Tepidisphaeraceae bacterium]|jgi:leucyl-tRNA synthetase|nr:leucine--tRNA ligase [Tepidisphaeraceae bacterium]